MSQLSGASTVVPFTRKRTRSFSDSDVARFQPLVRRLAIGLRHRLPLGSSREDLESAGWIALIECSARSAELVPDDEFENFASCRVRGAMLDHVRAMEPGSRVARNAFRRAAHATRAAEAKLGREASERERAQLTQGEMDKALLPHFVDVTEMVELRANDASPEEAADMNMTVERLRAAIVTLPERLQTVLALFHVEGCTHVEIARVLSMSPSRAVQLHAEARTRLRAAMESEPTSNGAASTG